MNPPYRLKLSGVRSHGVTVIALSKDVVGGNVTILEHRRRNRDLRRWTSSGEGFDIVSYNLVSQYLAYKFSGQHRIYKHSTSPTGRNVGSEATRASDSQITEIRNRARQCH